MLWRGSPAPTFGGSWKKELGAQAPHSSWMKQCPQEGGVVAKGLSDYSISAAL